MLPAKPDIKWKLAKQVGVSHAVTKAAPELSGLKAPYDFESLKEVKERFSEAGLKLHALEGDEFDMTKIKLGLPGRDADIEAYRMMLKNMGRLEIPLLCLNFMAGVGWYRTKVDIPERGGALTSGFDMKDAAAKELVISEEKLWDNLLYFLKAVVPAAEEAGVKMGLHPDDPPVSPLMGYSRILTSADAYRKILAEVKSPALGITFCQATFKAMGEDVIPLIHEFGKAGKIFFVHFRDIEGKKTSFRETFHDNGPSDMAKLMTAYRDAGVDCLIRTDHAPTMAGERNDNPGYEMTGTIFAIGYLKGIMDSINLQYK